MWLKDVRIETGFHMEDKHYAGTNTKAVHVKIADGRVEEVIPADQKLDDSASFTEGDNSFTYVRTHVDI